MADVRLVDLEVIKRFSLAVRQDTVPAEELLAALDASRATVLAALAAESPAGDSAPSPVDAPPPTRRPRARRAAAKTDGDG